MKKFTVVATVLLTMATINTKAFCTETDRVTKGQSNYENNYNLDNQLFYCHTEQGENIQLVVPIPKNIPKGELGVIGDSICNSIRSITFDAEPKCDTDYNCEILYDRYKDKGVTGVFVAEDKWQTNNIVTEDQATLNTVVEVHCSDGRITLANSSIPEELRYTCSKPKDTIKRLAHQAKNTDIDAQVSLDWKELIAAIELGYTTLQSRHNMSPTIEEFILLMKEHIGLEALGYFRIREGEAKENSLDIDSIWARFGSKHEVPTWFLDFCKYSDTNPTNVINNVPGWMCIWD